MKHLALFVFLHRISELLLLQESNFKQNLLQLKSEIVTWGKFYFKNPRLNGF